MLIRYAARMLFDLDDETELLRRTVREFAEGEVAPVAEELDREKRFPADIVRSFSSSNSRSPWPTRRWR